MSDRTRIKTRHPGIYYREDAAGRRYIVWYTCSGCKPAGGCSGHTETLPLESLERDAVDRRAELMSRKAKGDRIVVTKLTFGDVADLWIESIRARAKPKTMKTYESVLKIHLRPRFGQRKLTELSIDDVASMIAELQGQGKKAWTIRSILTVLSRVFAHAIRQGWVVANPVKGLDRTERPKSDQAKMRILSSDEIEKVIKHTPKTYRVLLTTLTFTGMRISEALALTWAQIDFAAGLITVGKSKTAAGTGREIVLMPGLGKVLREHKLASGYSTDDDLVFVTSSGGAVSPQAMRRDGLGKALERACVDHIRLHDLRHTFASILIGEGMDVTFVADQLGHANPGITLSIYAKLFDPVRRRDEAREKLETSFGGLL